MGVGSFDLLGGPTNLSYLAEKPIVALYNADAGEGEAAFTPLPNVCPVRIDERVGPSPPVAYFRYLFDDLLNGTLGWPGRVEDVWPLDASGPYVVRADDRIVIFVQNPDGQPLFLFDGFAQIPQADIAGRSEGASFTAVGVAAREFDNPISGRRQRDSSPNRIGDTSGDYDVQIDLPCRFNPANDDYGDDGGILPNKTPAGKDTVAQQDGDGNATRPASPVFVDTDVGHDEGRTGDKSADYWSISDAIKYILAEYNPRTKYTDYPDPSTLDDLLATSYAADDTGPIQPGDILSDPLILRDYDASNKPWPEAVAELLGYAGFVMRWALETDQDGLPHTIMYIYRRDMLSTTPVRQFFLDRVGNSLAQGSLNNVCAMHLARDTNHVVNAWQVETHQRQVEISVLLAPLYRIAAGDESPGTRKQWTKSYQNTNDSSGTDRRKYRWYGVDEQGDGFWSVQDAAWTTNVYFDFTPVFPDTDDGYSTWAIRYRPALGHLAMRDSQGRPLKARLDVGFGKAIDAAEFYDGTGDTVHWFNVPSGWELLPDRLGIRLTVEDPEEWTTGSKDGGPKKIMGVSGWANPSKMGTTLKLGGSSIATNGKPPLLRLTCVIEDDLRMPISVGKRVGSPTQFARWRVADGRDHFQYTSIDKSSPNYQAPPEGGPDPNVVRDDTDAATSHARALQRANEMPPLAGSVTLPGLAFTYEIGDRIDQVVGRGIDLFANVGQSQGEENTYPTIVGRSFTFDPEQHTELHLSDFRGEYHAHRQHYARAGGNDY